MKKVVLVMTIMLVIVTGCAKELNITVKSEVESLNDSSNILTPKESVAYQKISAKEAKEMIENEAYHVILDVRTIEEYTEGHIEEAILLPNNEIEKKAETLLQSKDEIILVYCRSGRRSEAAARELIDLGYLNVYDFGGIVDWPYEIVKE